MLKKENIEGEKANEYLGILDNKSQRLKKLTEDLVEASKASSGAIKLNMEKLNVNELIKQISGEFQDKFEAHKLEEIISFPEEEAYIEAQGKCTCPKDLPYCVCGYKSYGKIITKKPIIPTKEEQEENPRSKSAKLRIFERMDKK